MSGYDEFWLKLQAKTPKKRYRKSEDAGRGCSTGY